MAKTLQIGVKALFFDKGKVLLIKRSGTTDAPKGIWDIPGGRIEIGEEPVDALKREVEEEIGRVKFSVIKPIQVKTRRNDQTTHIVRVTYLCRFFKGAVNLSHEHDEFGWFDVDNLPKKVDNLTKEAIIQQEKFVGS